MAVAVKVNSPHEPPWNPFRCSGTALPPPVLLMAKLVVFSLLVSMEWRSLPDPFLPFLPIFDHVGSGPLFRWVLKAVFLGASAALLFNRRVRAACLVSGSAFLVAVLSSRVYFQNNRLFAGCLLLLAGLTESDGPPWLLRAQVLLVYFAAGFNKLLDASWRSGAFFESWAGHFIKERLYFLADSRLPAMLLPKFFCWSTIAGELGLPAGLLIRRFRTAAIWLGILFHTGLLFLTYRTFGVFYYCILASYLAFVDWPRTAMTVLYDGDCGFCDRTRRLFERFDVERLANWAPFQAADSRHGISEEALQQRLHLVVNGRIYAGFAAFKMLLLYNPIAYFVAAAVLAAPEVGGFHYRRWVALLLWVLFAPVFTPIGEKVYRLVADNRHRIPGDRVCKVAPRDAA